jgi:hypothetical protein
MRTEGTRLVFGSDPSRTPGQWPVATFGTCRFFWHKPTHMASRAYFIEDLASQQSKRYKVADYDLVRSLCHFFLMVMADYLTSWK